MREVCCPVKRIDYPPKIRVGILVSALFGKNIVRRKMLFDFPDNERFGLAIDFCDEVGFLTIFPLDVFYFSNAVLQKFSRLKRGFNCDV